MKPERAEFSLRPDIDTMIMLINFMKRGETKFITIQNAFVLFKIIKTE